MLHRIDPFALHFGGGVGIRWYGLSYVAGFAAAYLIIRWLGKRQRTSLDGRAVGDFIFALVIGTMLGGRLGYALFYDIGTLGFSDAFPYWNFLALYRGGMASHGGIVGIILACIWFARRHGHSALHLIDLTAMTGALGIFFGRIANFVNGELLGRPCSATLPWAVKFPHEIIDWPAIKLADPHFVNVVQMLGVDASRWTDSVRMMGYSDAAISFVHQTLQDIITTTRSSDAVAAALEPLLTWRHPSQLYEALLEGALLFAVLWMIWRVPRKPGLITGAFLVLYAAVRIFGELFRTPDAQIAHQEFALTGVTRGQWLSFFMLLVGVGCLIYWMRRPVQKIGGWGPKGICAPAKTKG